LRLYLYNYQDLLFIGELQDGIYDDEYEGLTYEEINIAYGFDEDGEHVDEDMDGSDESENDYDSNYDEIEAADSGIEVCLRTNLSRF